PIVGCSNPAMGEISIMGQAVAGVPAYRRPVNTVFQSYALFPHMTVAKNVAFGLEMAKVPKEEITRRVDEALELVQMGTYHERRPTQLSGGQKQRVALARALVNRPRVLLLDEPLGALDLKLRKDMQLELKQIQSEVGITFIYVTHDQEEAITMSDRIAVMSDGLVQQLGSSREIYEHPANRFVADFIGETNFINGRVAESGTQTTLESNGVQFTGVSREKLATGSEVTLAIRPEKLLLTTPAEAAANQGANGRVTLNGTIADVIYIGTDNRYQVELVTGDKIFVRVQNLGAGETKEYGRGDSVAVQWQPSNAQVLTE
ncbi:MAG: ABC transporter ATP-binding protein, partial [Sphaerospermopsis sp. SIO1G2]|nr:ABC transporter ATP-binding protein [Sphaerospermopsis sp. SIO1G2]